MHIEEKHFSLNILLTGKFYYVIVLTFSTIGQNVYCNDHFPSRWRHES